MEKLMEKSEQTQWQASDSTNRMEQILGVKFNPHNRWKTTSKDENDGKIQRP